MKKVSIFGAGGHTLTLINILELNRIKIDCIYELTTRSEKEKILTYDVINIDKCPNDDLIVISKGSIESKKLFLEKFKLQLFDENIVHPNALVETSKVGCRNQISATSYLTQSSEIGDDNIIYSGSIIEHESKIGNMNIITVNVSICGRVKIGNNCFLGAGCTILPNLTICDEVTIGAGAVVTEKIDIPGTYVGIPAKRI